MGVRSENQKNFIEESTNNIDAPVAENDEKMAKIEQMPPTEGQESAIEKNKVLNNYMTFNGLVDTLHSKSAKPVTCKKNLCMGSFMSGLSAPRPIGTPRPRDELIEQAKDFLEQYYNYPDRCSKEDHFERLDSVMNSIRETGTYDLTYDELCFGTKTAWRNAPRCIGRMQWNKLHVFDRRDVKTTDQMFEAICDHIREATNNGNLKSVITVFPQRVEGKPDFRVWNPHLLSYAGYQQDDGSVIGDPAKVKLTQICQKLGWKGKGGRFDILPLVLNASGTDPKYYEIPSEIVLEVELKHPEFDWFEDMALRWYALPAVSDMAFDIGGIEFPAAPFNGWYMSSEIGGRDLCDRQRYNITEEVAVKMGLDTTSTINLWKDQAYVEINRAVIHSFQAQNVTIVDHHTASENFIKHMQTEQKLRGGCPADWVWIVPPISGGLTQVFHQEMLNYNLKPSYEYQEKAWISHVWINKQKEKELKESGRKIKMSSVAKTIFFASYLMNKYMKQRTKATILYATETGKSEAYAKRIGEVFRRAFNSEVRCMDNYDIDNIDKDPLVIIVTSTFGSGDAPDNGKNFAKGLAELRSVIDINNNNESKSAVNLMANNNNNDHDKAAQQKTKFSVFALGSSAYPDFCAFGKTCDTTLDAIGLERLVQVATADELKGEEQSFKKWAQEVFSAACKQFNINIDSSINIATEMEENEWTPDLYRLSRAGEQLHDIYEGLSKMHHKKVLPCRMTSRVQLQSPQSNRQTFLARFDTKGAEDLQYSPGDHVGVFPTNRPELVAGIARRLKNVPSLNDLLLMQTVDKENSKYGRVKTWKDTGRLPPCSITTALCHYLDITTPPTQQFLKLLAKSANEADQRAKLDDLATNDDMYETWKTAKWPNLLETLEEFDSVRLDAAMMLKVVPLMQPRFYSISSSPVMSHGEIHVTVAVVTYKTQDGDGPTHYGVCSNFLNSFPNNDVPCFIRKAPNFHMPDDSSRPIIMVGPGTGIAPFRGFLQQRQYEMPPKIGMKASTKTWFRGMFECNAVSRNDHRLGKMTLFFGCRHPTVDDIYRQELNALSNQLIGFESHVAYSRVSGKPKTYVQDLLKKEGANIYRQLTKEQGHLYICGDASMASEVRNVLKEVIATHSNNMCSEDVNNYVLRLKAEGRFHEDIFGVLIKTK